MIYPLIVFLNARFCLQLRLQTSNCFCKGLYLRYLCLIRKELLWLNNYPYLNVMLLSECFIKTIHSPLLEETLIVLLPLLLVKFCIIDASQAESLLWAKMTVLTGLVANATLFVPKWVFMVVLHPDVSVVLKELFVHLSAIIMILFSAIYSISLPMSAATVRCRRDVKRTRLITAHKANAAHHKSIKDAHSGVRKTPKELREIAEIIEPLIAKG